MMPELKKIGSLIKKEQRYKLILFIGILGIGLIFLSDMLSSDKEKEQASPSESTVSNDPDEYARKMEKKLSKILGSVSGVGDCEVMLTIGGTTEYVYAENISRSTDLKDGGSEETYKNEIVFTEEGGEKEALVKKVIRPQISGVIIVCDGGGDVKVKERVIKAVSRLLDVPSDKICVECRNQ